MTVLVLYSKFNFHREILIYHILFQVCLLLALAAVAAAAPKFPKKYDPILHGPKRTSTYKQYKKKYHDTLKAPEGNSYDGFSGTPEIPLQPPAEYPYLRSDGEAHGELAPPPSSTDDSDATTSSYLVYDKKGEMMPMLPPPVSSYAVIPASNDGADAMSFLRFLVRALPKDSSYSRYDADPEPKDLSPPGRLPESSYLAYAKSGKSDKFKVPSSEPHKEKTFSSYSSYKS